MNRFLNKTTDYAVNHWVVVVVGVMISTYVLAMVLGMMQSIWFDESYSIMLAQRPLHELFALTAVDAHPPFYYLYLKLWGSLFGWSEFALRSSSAILGAAGIGMAMLLVRTMFTKRVALAVVPFIVIAPFLLRYDYEVRMYAMVSLIGITATWVLLRATSTKQKKWWVYYALLVALGMYTLYMTVAIWLAHAVWLSIIKYRQKKSILAIFKQPAVFAYIGAIALFLPYTPVFLGQMLSSALPPGVGSSVTTEKLVGIVSELFSYRPDWQVGLIERLVFLFVLSLAVYLFFKIWKHATKERKNKLLLMLALVFVPVIFYTIISYILSPLFVFRYMAHVAVYSYILLGLLIVLGWHISRRVAIVGAVVILGLLVEGTIHLQRLGNYNLERIQHPVAKQVRHAIKCDESTTIVTDDLYAYIDMQYYFDDCDLRFNNHEDPANFGGFAVLRGSEKRVDSVDDISTKRLLHIYQSDLLKTFNPTQPYELSDTRFFDVNVVDTYIRR